MRRKLPLERCLITHCTRGEEHDMPQGATLESIRVGYKQGKGQNLRARDLILVSLERNG